MSQAVVLSHRDIAHELGPLGDWLDGRGFAVQRIYREDGPDVPDADLFIALGSPGSVADGHCRPAGTDEIARIRDWVDAGRPYLGICYGSQALALAGGGSVRRMLSTDRGWMLLNSTSDPGHRPTDRPHLLMGPWFAGPWLVWHEDGLTAPAHATVLARSGNADQVFTYGRAWGIQFHPELDSGALARMAKALGAPAEDYQPLADAMRADEAGHRERALRLFDAFWDDVNRLDD